MTERQIVRAWKDEDYRLSLSEAELSALPENPAGLVQLSELEMGKVGGETGTGPICIVITATMDFWCPDPSLLRCNTLSDCASLKICL
jgi:mersacidin/lichenicidin family type 2 lantibiotic